MRTTFLGVCVACMLLNTASQSVAAPTDTDDAAGLNSETPANRRPDRWQGRHHYLYDDEHQPTSGTVGSSPSDERGCASQSVRMRRSDGTTVVRRLKRCE